MESHTVVDCINKLKASRDQAIQYSALDNAFLYAVETYNVSILTENENLKTERDDYKRKMEHEHIVAEHYLKLSEKYKLALEEICKPTYGTELCNTDEENNEILARHYSIYRNIAREALK
jgi:hypothetical protein